MIDLLRDNVVGRSIRAFEIHGINALKTVDPPIDVLVGATVDDASIGEGGQLQLTCGDVELTVDLARTGGIEHREVVAPWERCGNRIPPTGRLLLADGGGIDFSEPARTKRVTFTLSKR